MRKSLALLMLLILTLSFFAGCSKPAENSETPSAHPTASTEPTPSAAEPSAEPSSEPQPTGEELTIGILPAESAIPIILAKEMGYFNEMGVNVSIQAFSSPNDRNVAVQAGELDGVYRRCNDGRGFCRQRYPHENHLGYQRGF